jgi:AcrR family transcriptional regulator
MKADARVKAKSARMKRTSSHSSRDDGDATKARIIEEAGHLFAERGYADVTSKDICEQAGTNIASVNYHFGSREGLYVAILQEVRNKIFNLESLSEIADSDMQPREKMAYFIDNLVAAVFGAKSWQVRVWGREMVNPTGLGAHLRYAKGVEKFGKVGQMIAEITGMAVDDPRIRLCILNVMAPCLVLLIVPRKQPTPHQQIFESTPETVAAHLKKFLFAGLDAFTIRPSGKENAMPAFISTS